LEPWFQLSIEVPADLSDAISGFLFGLDCCGLEETDGPVSGEVAITAYFASTAGRERVLGAVVRELDRLLGDRGDREARVGASQVPREDWKNAWRSHFSPVYATRRIVVCPPWDPAPEPEDGFRIVIEPKTAFGTGRHETTRLSLVALEAIVAPGDRVLDVGCGSGILSVAAAKLGGAHVSAVDTDPGAVENSRENARLNGVEDRIRVETGSVGDLGGCFDVVAANLTVQALIPMLPALRVRAGESGQVILAGVLEREEAAFLDAVGRAGMNTRRVLREGEWICAVAAGR
jgi:ribosomal protein L11 methyltransferase